uniref:N-acetylglucosaminylphosphatidylinositol deacetylase n=1 Tax=Strombidium rassoulzadegani TaxID=1082188 RepID=A0A7S3CNW0_9SPIT|mmetsp:Transcript_18175/g.31085  ORF Transcript_18175/g.31085 Transcript_18175/m.31085 type:complete len:283 (+) Transcript_18175:32-880(+)
MGYWSFLFLALILLYFLAMKYTSRFNARGHRKLQPNTLFVLAHPDDECMFFTPTIHGMQQSSNLYILILCNGGWDGLGKVRELEMEQSAKYQGFVDVKVIDDPRLKDNPGANGESPLEIWDVDVVVEQIHKHIKALNAEKGKEIGTIVTFDHLGVSMHTNHIATHYGCLKYYQSDAYSGDMYTLETIPMFRKYDFFLDNFLARLDQVNYFLHSPFQAATALAIHHSQFVWYRKLFMGFSRYVYYNGLNYYPSKSDRAQNSRRQVLVDHSEAKAGAIRKESDL